MSNFMSLSDFSRDNQNQPGEQSRDVTRSYAGGERSGLAIENPNEPKPQSGPFIVVIYRNGFTVNEGPLRSRTDDEGAKFLQDLREGYAPRELQEEHIQRGGNQENLAVQLIERPDSDYNGAENSIPAVAQTNSLFTGEGQSLGGAVSSSSAAQVTAHLCENVDINVDEPTTTIQFRLPDGTKKQQKFNLTHSVQVVLSFASSLVGGAPVTLVGGFPPRPIRNTEVCVKEADLCGSQLTVQV